MNVFGRLFRKPVDHAPNGFTDADDLYLSEMVRRAGRLPSFVDTEIVNQPSHHLPRYRS